MPRRPVPASPRAPGRSRRAPVLALVLLAASVPLALSASQGRRGGQGGPPARVVPMHRVGGVRDGASIFPKVDYVQTRPLVPGQVDFKHFHTPEESLALMRGWAQQFPDLVEVYSVGQSFEGRDIWQMTITNKKTGKDTDKPAFFLEGGRHSGEATGSEATLYFINHVLTSYGKDPEITRLVDTRALYCKPHNNPDGNTLVPHHGAVEPQHRPAERR